MNDNDDVIDDPRLEAIPDVHGHAKGEHKPFAEERPIALSARMLFLWFFHACRRGGPRFLMVSDHMNYLTFEDPAAVNLVRRALKLAAAGDLYGAAETAGVEVGHTAVVSEGLRRGMRYSIGAEVDNDPRCRPDAQNIVDAMRPDGLIRSVHFITIDHPTEGPNYNWAFDNPEFIALFDHVGTERTWEIYAATLVDAIERLPGNIIGHFYVPAIFGHWPDEANLERYEDQMLDAAAARGMAVEINTRFLYRDHPEEQRERYKAANLRLMRKAREKGVGIAIGSDAHSPKDQGGAFDQVLALLDEAEVNELVFPIAGRLARVALRATKEHLERSNGVVEEPHEPPAPLRETVESEVAAAAPLETAPPEPEVVAPRPARKRPPRKTRAAEPASAPDGAGETAAVLVAEPPAVEIADLPELTFAEGTAAAPAVPEPVAAIEAHPAQADPVAETEHAAIAPTPEPPPVAKAARPAKAPRERKAPASAKAAVKAPVIKAPEPKAVAPKPAAVKASPAAKSAASARKPAAKKPKEPARKTAGRKAPAKAVAAPKGRAAAKARPAAKTTKPAKKAAAKKVALKAKAAAPKRAAAKASPARAATRKGAKPAKPPAKRTAKPAPKKATAKKSAVKKSAPKRGR